MEEEEDDEDEESAVDGAAPAARRDSIRTSAGEAATEAMDEKEAAAGAEGATCSRVSLLSALPSMSDLLSTVAAAETDDEAQAEDGSIAGTVAAKRFFKKFCLSTTVARGREPVREIISCLFISLACAINARSKNFLLASKTSTNGST